MSRECRGCDDLLCSGGLWLAGEEMGEEGLCRKWRAWGDMMLWSLQSSDPLGMWCCEFMFKCCCESLKCRLLTQVFENLCSRLLQIDGYDYSCTGIVI